MKQKMVISLLCCFIVMLASGFAIGQDNKGKPSVDVSKGEKAEKGFDLPSIDEVFKQAKSFKIIDGWKERINTEVGREKIKECKTESCKAIQAGRTLAEIGYLILEKEKGEGLTEHILNGASATLESLTPPEDIKKELDDIKKMVKEDSSFRGEPLRKRLDELVKSVFPKMRENADKNMVNRGMLAFSGGFFRAMYLGASSVAKKDKPDQKELVMFRYGGIIDYLVNFFTKEAVEPFKSSEEVKMLLNSLETIGPLVKKAEKDITKQDVEIIAKTLEGQFKDQVKSN